MKLNEINEALKGCPADADTTHWESYCKETIKKDGFTWQCTRKRGHSGKHHAHDSNGKCYFVW